MDENGLKAAMDMKAEKVLADIKAAIKRRLKSKCPCVALKMDCNACDGCDKFSDREEK